MPRFETQRIAIVPKNNPSLLQVLEAKFYQLKKKIVMGASS